MAYSSLPLLFGLVAPLTFWACETCEIISFADAAEHAEAPRAQSPMPDAQDATLTQSHRPNASPRNPGGPREASATRTVPVTDTLAVAAQPTVGELKQWAAAGYRTLISSRPAGEASDQPSPEVLAAEAARLGMAFVYVPVTVESITRIDVTSFHNAVSGSEGPVVAHCRSGQRAYLLWAAGEVLEKGRTPAELIESAKLHGFDLRALPAVLKRIGH